MERDERNREGRKGRYMVSMVVVRWRRSLFLECEKERKRERGERGGEISNKEVKR